MPEHAALCGALPLHGPFILTPRQIPHGSGLVQADPHLEPCTVLVSPPQHPLTSSPHRPGSQECFPSCAEGKLTSRSSTSALRLAPRSPASARSSGLKSSRKRRRRQGGAERPMYEGAQLTLLFPHALVLWHASAQERSRGVHGCRNACLAVPSRAR